MSNNVFKQSIPDSNFDAGIVYKIRWAVTKIMNRDAFYLPRRLSYSINRFVADATFPYRGKNRGKLTDVTPADPAQLLHYFRTRQNPRFHFHAEDIAGIVAQIPRRLQEKTIDAAKDILSNRFTHKGIGPILLNPMDWEYDDPGFGGWRWAVNRHFMFMTLGFAYWYTLDRRFAEKFFELSTSWIDSYIGKLGTLDWDHPFEVAARINAWIWAYFLFLPCSYLDPGFHQKFLRALGSLADYLYEVIEYHNPGNHIMLEAKALALCAGIFPEFLGAKRWREKSWLIIKKELKSQVCPDGVHAERSTMYHRIVAGELAELMLFCTRNGIESDQLRSTVCRMAEFETWITGGQRDMPVLGDAYREDNYYRFSSPAIAAASDSCFKPPWNMSECNDATYWVLGCDLTSKKKVPVVIPQPTLAMAFPSGGYFISRWGWDTTSSVLVWDCGPVGYHKNPYHCHLDTLSFHLAVDGVAIIIDPGIEELDVMKNRILRGSAAHNTVVIDGENQSILAPLGRKNEIWSPAKANLHTWAIGDDCVVMSGSHDGYQRLSHPVIHRRTIISMHNKYWLFFDRFEGKGSHCADQRFHLAPGTMIDNDVHGGSMTLVKEGVSLSFFAVVMKNDDGISDREQITLEEGISELTPNKMEPIQVINVRVNAVATFDMAAVMAPASTGITKVRPLKFSSGQAGIIEAIEIEGSNFCDIVCFGSTEKEDKVSFENWHTDANVLILRKHAETVAEVYAIGATQLFQGTVDLLEGQSALLHHIAVKGR